MSNLSVNTHFLSFFRKPPIQSRKELPRMSFAHTVIEQPRHEEIRNYQLNPDASANLKKAIADLKTFPTEVPLVIDGKDRWTTGWQPQMIPHEKEKILAQYTPAGPAEFRQAVKAALTAKTEWMRFSFEARLGVFLKAADLIAGPYREEINAATMLGQSKTWFESEIDAACELADFIRFNCYYAHLLYREQPLAAEHEWSSLVYRPLEGFVVAITPFNFTAIGGNLPIAPAIMGNTVIWKPSCEALLSNFTIMNILREAGLPDGVINFVPGKGQDLSEHVLTHPSLGGLHFTGSTRVFNLLWENIGKKVADYEAYPRLVGETGGKGFVFADSTADLDLLADSILNASFHYQGQKCSACSRAYIPESTWPDLWSRLESRLETLVVDTVENFEADLSAVISQQAFDKITGYIEEARNNQTSQIIWGGEYSDEQGFFIQPTVILTRDPTSKTMQEEIFGPVLTVYCYEDNEMAETLALCNQTSPYALTGSIFSNRLANLELMENTLRYAAGNMYINDKPTGSVVARQPFGGGRKSGTNDKSGTKLNLIRWTNPQTVKRRFI